MARFDHFVGTGPTWYDNRGSEPYLLAPSEGGFDAMSTAPGYRTKSSDRFQYGWRYVTVTRPDGSEEMEQVPLSLEDVLHPEEGDFIVQTDAHNCDRGYLQEVFKLRLRRMPSAAVLADRGVDLNIPGVRHLCPDIAVFIGVKRHTDWNIFDVAAEGAKTALVVEVTSRSTRKNDLGVKLDYSHRAQVPLYLIADAIGRGASRRVELILYQYAKRGFRRIAPDEQGRVYLEPVDLYIGVTRDRVAGYQRLACYDPKTGDELGDYGHVVEAYAAALERAQEAEREARLANRRAAAAKRRSAAATERAAVAARAAETAESRAEAEAQARAGAESRIRELEAQLKHLKKPT
jgi:colicin import membrane protein